MEQRAPSTGSGEEVGPRPQSSLPPPWLCNSMCLSTCKIDLAFRLFAPLIRMPLRNLCRISVHSFSLMKHQISFTNNSRVISTHSRPSQHGCKSGKCSESVRSGSPRTAHHCGTQVKVLTLSGSSDWERQKELVVFKETQYCVSSIWYSIWECDASWISLWAPMSILAATRSRPAVAHPVGRGL